MHKHTVCVSAGALALALLSPAVARADLPPGPPPHPDAVRPTPVAPVEPEIKIQISDEDALNDDILAVIDLPLAAAEARAAGVDEAELKEALEVTRDAGLSAGEATEVVAEEVEATSKRGKASRGFGQWVRVQVASGLRGKTLAAKIRERKDEAKELSPEEADKLKAQLGELSEKHRKHREALLARRQELVAKGKKKVLVAKDRHDKLEAKLAAAPAKPAVTGGPFAERLRILDERIAAASEREKPGLEAEKKRLEEIIARQEKAAGPQDKAADGQDKAADAQEGREVPPGRLDKRAPEGKGAPEPKPAPPGKALGVKDKGTSPQ